MKIVYYILAILLFFSFGINLLSYVYDILKIKFALSSLNIKYLTEFNPFGDYSFAIFYFVFGGIIGSKRNLYKETNKKILFVIFL